MSIYRPGEFTITDKAFELMKLPQNAEILEIGCGEGDSIEYLEEKGYVMTGIDMNLERLGKAKERRLKADIKFGDGEFLDEFSSYSFDCVMMECVLSLINIPDEALHEAYCVLKKGGKLYISDLMVKNPSVELIESLTKEVAAFSVTPHKEGECSDDCAEDHKNRPFSFKSGGRFIVEPLIKVLEEIGYQNITWEDRSEDLASYVAEQIFEHGSLKLCADNDTLNPEDGFKTGYFMLVAEKV